MTVMPAAMVMLEFLSTQTTGRHSTATATSLKRTILVGSCTHGQARERSTWLEIMASTSFQIGDRRGARGGQEKIFEGLNANG
jgi:hypothetical protein